MTTSQKTIVAKAASILFLLAVLAMLVAPLFIKRDAPRGYWSERP